MKKAVLVLLLVIPFFVSAQSDDKSVYVRRINYKLEQPFGGQDSIESLAEYINTIYQFALGIVGIIAVVLIMFGGLRWVAAAGNESIIGEAKEIITSAVVGLAIALLSYIILAFINPQFTTAALRVPAIPITIGDNIWDYDACTDSKFKDQDCNTDGGLVKCETVACGQTGIAESAVCRGTVCSDDNPADGTDKCYRDPSDSVNKARCQIPDCGRYVDRCYRSNTKDEAALKACICDAYPAIVKRKLNFPPVPGNWTPPQVNLFTSFCTEKQPQTYWITEITSDPTTYGYTAASNIIAKNCWNLVSGLCQYTTSSIPTTAHACVPK